MTTEWTNKEIDYVIKNRLNKTYKEIGNAIGRTRSAVSTKLNKMGYKLPEKYTFDRNYFHDIDTEEKAYWLGFFFADGYIASDTEVAIMLKSTDKNHLKKLNQSIQGNMNIKIVKKTLEVTKKEYELCSIRIYSGKFVNDLVSHGVTKRKSMTIKFPRLEKDLVRHFIRGFFDGDGSISIDKRKKQLRCKFTSASMEFLLEIKKILESKDIHHHIVLGNEKNKSSNMGITGKSSNKKFLEYIYDDCNIYLDRKYKFYHKNKGLLDYLYDGWNNK